MKRERMGDALRRERPTGLLTGIPGGKSASRPPGTYKKTGIQIPDGVLNVFSDAFAKTEDGQRQSEVPKRPEAQSAECAAPRADSKTDADNRLKGTDWHSTVDPDVAKRRAIARNNSGVSAQGLCTLMDEAKIPVPKNWACYGSWTQANRQPEYRRRIQVILSKDKKKP